MSFRGFALRLTLCLIICSAACFQLSRAVMANPVVDPPRTYCNPMNLDYAYVQDKLDLHGHEHRSTADPVCIMYKGLYYLFATNQEGYWWSEDLARWHFVEHLFALNGSADQVCAPAAWPTSKGILFIPSFGERDSVPLYLSKEPRGGAWTEVVESFSIKAWDPSFFEDDDHRLYLYWNSSNFYPLYGVELDPEHGYQAKGKIQDLVRLDPKNHGWERFGEDNLHGAMDPFIEGAWMNKFGGKYYLQYGAPGTEWNVYGDGVYVAEHPLGPFTYQKHNPFSFKPTGFIRGAGHGSTFPDRFGNIWHVATGGICVKNTFERRIELFPAGVDSDGILYTDTAFGDYPHFVPKKKMALHEDFTGWLLLSYKKKSWASSSKNSTDLAFDEDIKTYWSAKTGTAGEYLVIDLGSQKNVYALQINYADEEAKLYGKQYGAHHQYKIFDSDDGKNWHLVIDKSRNTHEVPHEYIELSKAVHTRYLKIENVEIPTGCFAISGFRVFGQEPGAVPDKVAGFSVARDNADKRNVALHWQPTPHAYAYEIAYGIAPDKLYGSALIYDNTNYEMHSLNLDTPYYFQIRAVAETGISEKSEVVGAQ